jgi:mannose-6-phosphate isomerase-like protein (cupin superfamily)
MQPSDYDIRLAVAFDFLDRIDVANLVAGCTERWWNQTLCRVNDCVVRLGVIQGDFHWHQHDQEDEFFLVLEGELLIDLEDRTVALAPQQGFAVPRGVRHRTHAPVRTAILMVEGATVTPTGDEAASPG